MSTAAVEDEYCTDIAHKLLPDKHLALKKNVA